MELLDGTPAEVTERALALSTALVVCLPGGDRLLADLGTPQDQDTVKRILLDRPAEDRARLAARWAGGSVHAWLAIRELIRAGELDPIRSPEYFGGWFSWAYVKHADSLADRLRADPEALTEIWDLLTREHTGNNSFGTFDKFVNEPAKWSAALADLCAKGDLDRTRLFDRGHRGVFALLELAADLCERGAGTLSPHATQWLGGFTGSSKAAKAAARLVK